MVDDYIHLKDIFLTKTAFCFVGTLLSENSARLNRRSQSFATLPGCISAIKKTRYAEEQRAFILRQAETGTRIGVVCRKMDISEAPFYNWKKKFSGLGVTELRFLRQLEEENQRLKKLVADLSMDKEMKQEVLKQKFLGQFRSARQ